MAFMFRFPLDLAEGQRIQSESEQVTLSDEGGVAVFIKTGTGERLEDVAAINVVGKGYLTENEARQDGERWFDAIPLAFARVHLGADFRLRRSASGFFSPFLDQVAAKNPGVRVVNDEPGVLVYPEKPQVNFARIGATVRMGINVDETIRALCDVHASNASPDSATRLAFAAFSASFTMPSVDSRFIMLMVAVEALIERSARPPDELRDLEALREHVKQLDLADGVKDVLLTNMDDVRRESIGAAGRRLASELGDKKYMDLDPVAFFKTCYPVRSALVHGNATQPEISLVMDATGPLQWFVADLIAVRGERGTLGEAMPP